MGDFNEALSLDEQLGGNPRSEYQMQAFRDCLEDRGLTDLGFKGYPFTWNNRREGTNNIQVRLDRGTTTASFLDLFPNTQIEHIITKESDHMALLVQTEPILLKEDQKTRRGFAFEEMWTKHDNYEDMIANSWETNANSQLGIGGLWQCLCDMSADMKKWSFETFGSVRAELKSLRGKLEEAKAQSLVSGASQEV
jgi:hypothetical protein